MTPASNTPKSRCRYEVQFKSEGAWRRWSSTNDLERAKRSLARLESHFGEKLVAMGFTRLLDSEAE